jgi:hypothetical protein
MALRQLHKHCFAVNAENARQEAVRAAAASAEAKRPAGKGTALAKSKIINPGASVKTKQKQPSSSRAAPVASYQDRTTLSAYYNVMHAVGATSENYRGGRVVLRFVIC